MSAYPLLDTGVQSPQSAYRTSARQEHSLGQIGRLHERTFRYASHTGAAALDVGAVTIPSAPVANHVSGAWVSGGAANTNTVTFTIGATAATANQYAEGYLAVIDGVGQGQMRRVESNPAHAGTGNIEITVRDNFEVDLGAGEMTLLTHKFAAPVISAGNVEATPIGVPQFEVPIGSTTPQYYWTQTAGPGLVLSDAAGTIGTAMVLGTTDTAGAGEVTPAAEASGTPGTSNIYNLVGHVLVVSDADADHILLDLRLE